MKVLLIGFYAVVLIAMLVVVTVASLNQNMFEAGGALMRDPWFVATLADAYFAFFTIALWIAWKERFGVGAWLWVIAVLGLGNIAIAAYALWQLARWRPALGIEALLLRRAVRS